MLNNIRGKNVDKAIELLERVLEMKQPIRMSRYNRDTAHKKGMSAGKYPVKTADQILKVVKSAKSNALNLGLNVNDLVIFHASAHKAARPWHFGRQRRRKMKRTHIEIALKEQVNDSKKVSK